jgi:hypothetical protein
MGLCSMPECRRKLIIGAAPGVGANAVVVGEHCHIVGEKETSPRGNSPLSTQDRDRHPNLILLCAEHHKIIDDNVGDWPVERLHQVKADHEIWVESRIPDPVGDVHLEIYAALVNTATANLSLNSWPDLTAGAILDRLPNAFVDGVYQFGIAVTAANWPRRFQALEVEIQNLSVRATAYLDMFMARATPDGSSWKRDDRWKHRWRDDYNQEVDKAIRWARECNRLLMNLTVALNTFAQTVRNTVQPTYFLSAGRFYVVDFMGVYADLQPMVYFPNQYNENAHSAPNDLNLLL